MSTGDDPAAETESIQKPRVCKGEVHIFLDKARSLTLTGKGRVAPWRLSAKSCQCGIRYTDIRGNGLGQRKPLVCIGSDEILSKDEIIERLNCEADEVTARAEKLQAGGSRQVNHRHGGSDGRFGMVGRNHAAKR